MSAHHTTGKIPRKRSIRNNLQNRRQLCNKGKIMKKKRLRRMSLCGLPTEILEQIVGNIHIWHRNRIRATCTRLRNVCDSALMHEFKSSLQKYGRKSKSCYEYVSLSVIHQATWAYVEAGYCPLFLGAMLPLMRNNYNNPFCPSVDKIRQFLMKFYKLVEENIGDSYSQKSRLLYAITLLGFVNKCKNAVLLLSTNIRADYWRAVYELKGSWMGMLHSSPQSRTLGYSSDRNELLILLAEIMISVHSETAFKKVWEGENKIFVFGHDMSQRVHLPRIIFTFDIRGSSQILRILKNCPSKGNLKNLSQDEFSLSLSIFCKEASKWGCYQTYRLAMGPQYREGGEPLGEEKLQPFLIKTIL